MSVRQRRGRQWFFRTVVRLPDGRRERIFGVPKTFGLPNTKIGAQEAERRAIERALKTGEPATTRKEVPTFKEWFLGRFWKEWVVGHRNKPSETESKESIFRVHLEPFLGSRRLDQIGHAEVAQLRASLVEKKLSDKRINNILAVLSKALRYAEEAELVEKPPRVRLYRVDKAEIEAWSFEEYGRSSTRRGSTSPRGMWPRSWPAMPGSASARSERWNGIATSTWSDERSPSTPRCVTARSARPRAGPAAWCR